MPAPPMPPGCPWSGFAPPDLKFCEDNVCGWIAAPANTWSNLAFVGVGVWLWRRDRRSEPHPARWFGPAAAAVGAASFLYHASYTYIFQFWDHVAMFVYVWLMLAAACARSGAGPRRAGAVFWGGTAASSASVLLLRGIGVHVQFVMAALVLGLLGCEARLALRGPKPRYAGLSGAGVLMAAAFAFWALDTWRVWCDPGNHWLQGHAIWHVLAALSFIPAHAYYRQFAPPSQGV